MDTYFYNARPPADDTSASVAAKPRKKHKYFNRQIRYVNTKEFRTGFTPVLPFDDPNKIAPGTSASSSTLAAPRHGRLPPLPAWPRKAHNTKVAPMSLADGDTAPDVRSPKELRAIVYSFCVEKRRSRREIFQNEAGNEEVRHNGRHRRRKERASTERQAGTTRRKIKRLFSKKKLQKDLENLAFPVQEKEESNVARSTVVAPRYLPGGGTQSQVKSVAELDHILSTHSSVIPAGTSAAAGTPTTGGDTTSDGSPRGNLISALLSADDSGKQTPREGGQVRQTTSSCTGGDVDNKYRGTLHHIRNFADRYLSHKNKPTKTKIQPFKASDRDDKSRGKTGNLREFAARYLTVKKGPAKSQVEAFSECDVDVPRQRGLWSRLFH